MSTQRDASKENEPQPREPFGQPTAGEIDGQVGDQKPGYDGQTTAYGYVGLRLIDTQNKDYIVNLVP